MASQRAANGEVEWNASAYEDPASRLTLLPIVERVDNGSLPTGPFGPIEHLRAWEDHQRLEPARRTHEEILIPLYISAPTHIPGSLAIGPSGPPPAPRSRRTSSSASHRDPHYRKHAIAPLSHYLCRTNSDEGLADVFAAQAALLEKENAVYSPEQRLLDSSAPIGFLRPAVVRAMLQDSEKMVQMRSKACWKALYPEVACTRPGTPAVETPGEILEEHDVTPPDCGPWCLAFEDWINEQENRTAVRSEHLDRLLRNWKAAGMFPEMLSGWRDEDYNIYGPGDLPRKYAYTVNDLRPVSIPAEPISRSNSRGSHRSSRPPRMTPSHSPPGVKHPLPNVGNGLGAHSPARRPRLPGGNVAFKMERAGTGLFGFLTFGAHLTAYVKKDGEYFLWVPRRSRTKQTWPGMLDNTVAGGISAGDSPTETIVRECQEEASLSEDVVLPRLKSVGLLSYLFRGKDGWLQPELQYLYDLELPPDVVPSTNDGEATDFRLLSVGDVLEGMWRGQWKPNCALAVVDFLVRHGLVTPERDARYLDVCTRMRRAPVLPGPA